MKIKALLYCTKAKPYLVERLPFNEKKFYQCRKKNDYYSLNGKIVAECDYEVEEITTFEDYTGCEIYYETNRVDYERLLQKSCLDNQQLDDYLYGDKGYAIHIKNLHIFDEPKELSDYMNGRFEEWDYRDLYELEKAPQNMQYVSSFYSDEIDRWGDTYILISIKPEWLCKILNGEKTIEVRKKVLKEMLK